MPCTTSFNAFLPQLGATPRHVRAAPRLASLPRGLAASNHRTGAGYQLHPGPGIEPSASSHLCQRVPGSCAYGAVRQRTASRPTGDAPVISYHSGSGPLACLALLRQLRWKGLHREDASEASLFCLWVGREDGREASPFFKPNKATILMNVFKIFLLLR